MLLSQRQLELDASAPSHLERMRVTLDDGAQTTVHVASYSLAEVQLRVERLPGPMTLEQWCAAQGVAEALVGGFYIREPQTATDPLLSGMPLGQLQTGGRESASIAFEAPWGARRACVHVVGTDVRIRRRDELPDRLEGDLLQAGPLLVEAGRQARYEDEGFSAGAGQFDSDITVGRHPRAALARDEQRLLAVACDGRTDDEAGLTLDELARTLIGLGADAALNLDGGGSTSLVCDGRLRNVPREGDGVALVGGRPIATALAFMPA